MCVLPPPQVVQNGGWHPAAQLKTVQKFIFVFYLLCRTKVCAGVNSTS